MSREAGARRDTVDGFVHLLLDTLRNSHRLDAPLASQLAEDVALHWAESTGREPPELLTRRVSETPPLPTNARRLQHAWLDGASAESRRAYLPALVSAVAAVGHHGSELVSSPSITRVGSIAATARLRHGTGAIVVFDPAVGAGSMLSSAAIRVGDLGYTPRALGQDINSEAARLAAASLFLGGMDADIALGDTLTFDCFGGEGVDIAISQPPFVVPWTGQQAGVRARHSDGWYPWGLPGSRDASWLFASRMIEKLKPPEAGGGRAVVFVAPSVLKGRGGQDDEIRRTLLEQDLLEAVIGLPDGLSTGTDLQLYALVFANKKPVARERKIQLINLRPYFGTSPSRRLAPRLLSEEAFTVLTDAFQTVKNGVASRTVSADYFLRRRVSVGFGRTTQVGVPLTWDVQIPGTAGTEAFLLERYGPLTPNIRDDPGTVETTLELDSSFDDSIRRLRHWLPLRDGGMTRLSAVLESIPRALQSGEDSNDPQQVLLPIGEGRATTDGHASGSGRSLLLRLAPGTVSARYLAAWLNSPPGLESRRRAAVSARTGTVINAIRSDPRSFVRFVDEVLVPVPSGAVQEAFEAADARLNAVDGMVAAARRDLWGAPATRKNTVRRFDPLFDRTLGRWADELPYPVASAIWLLATKKQNVHAAHKQMFLVWEAYAAFVGTVLLSALAQDPALKEIELGALREALENAHLTLERATLGTWKVIIERLSACFRRLLASDDPDEQARVRQTFGGPTKESLDRLLSIKTSKLLDDVIAKRNLWAGHAGAVPDAESRQHVTYLTTALEELRDEVSPAWQELRCVRAGTGAVRRGRTIQQVELVMGAKTPFDSTEVVVGSMMEENELYLVAHEAAQPLPLLHLMVMRTNPERAKFTCYFYSRLEGDGVRLVSYHLGEQSDKFEHVGDVTLAVHDLWAPTVISDLAG